MSAHEFTNARVHRWLDADLDALVKAMRTTRVQLNSAALWWFMGRLSDAERAEILGEYVKRLALGPPGAANPAGPLADGTPGDHNSP